MKQKIIFITSNNKTDKLGGQEIYINKLCRISKKFNLDYKLISPVSILSNFDTSNKKKEIILNLNKKKFIKNIFQILEFLKNKNNIFIISNDMYSSLIINFIKLFYHKIVHINIVHDINIWYNMKLILKLKKICYIILQKLCNFNTNAYWFYSEFLYLKYKTYKSVYLNPGIEKTVFLNKTAKISNIGWIGNNDLYKKGFDVFCKISNRLKNQYNFFCAGINSDTNILYNTNNITFKGYYNNIYEFIHQMDLIILPYRYEGLGLIFLEIISSGVPVIFSNIPSFNIIKFRVNYPKLNFNINDIDQCIYLITNYEYNKKHLKKSADKIKKIYSLDLLEKKYWQTLNNMLY